MVRPAGTVALVLLLVIARAAPPAGAGLDKVTTQSALPGAPMVPCEQVRAEGTTLTGAVRLTVVDWVWPFAEAEMVAVWLVLMVPLVAAKVALL
jgi:hypothetical protein